MTKKMRIGLDAGHPTFEGDFGCVYENIIEAEYTFMLARQLFDLIRNRSRLSLHIMGGVV